MTGPTKEDGQRRQELLDAINELPPLLKALDYLELLSELDSQSAVAERRVVARSSVSSYISRLESALGLDQAPIGLREIVRSGAANDLLVAARHALRAAEDVVLEANRLSQTQHIRLTCFNPHIKAFVATAIRNFHQKQSDYVVQLPRRMGDYRRVDYGDLALDVAQGQSDYAIVGVSGSTMPYGLNFEYLYHYESVLVVGEDHHLVGRNLVSTQQIVDLRDPLILGPSGYPSYELGQLIFMHHSRSFSPAMENPDTNSRVALARAGIGITIAHQDAIDEDISNSTLPIDLSAIDTSAIGNRIVVLWKKEHPMHQQFLDCLTESVATIRRTGQKPS